MGADFRWKSPSPQLILCQGPLLPYRGQGLGWGWGAPDLTEGLKLLLLAGFFGQGAEQSEKPGAGWGGDVQEEGESLAQRARGQPWVPHPAGRRAAWGCGGHEETLRGFSELYLYISDSKFSHYLPTSTVLLSSFLMFLRTSKSFHTSIKDMDIFYSILNCYSILNKLFNHRMEMFYLILSNLTN